jgi:hypothetical protein
VEDLRSYRAFTVWHDGSVGTVGETTERVDVAFVLAQQCPLAMRMQVSSAAHLMQP